MDAIKLLDNFVDDQTCDHMVQVYDKIFEGRPFARDGRKLIHNEIIPEVIDFLRIYVPKISEVLGKPYYVRDLLLSIYQDGAYVEPHTDFMNIKIRDSLGILFYFNEEFEGGEVYFSKFDFRYKPKKGSVLIFRCNDPEYEHGVTPVTSGVRYTLPLEITAIKEYEIIDL